MNVREKHGEGEKHGEKCDRVGHGEEGEKQNLCEASGRGKLHEIVDEDTNGWEVVRNRKKDNKITSFFFTNIPHNFGQKEFRKIFARYGKVTDIFIATRRNSRGRRYGFVRFVGVRNPRTLEQELDKICIGNQKLHVNLPKYQRSFDSKYRQKSSPHPVSDPKTLSLPKGRSYAQCVKEGKKVSSQIWKVKSRGRQDGDGDGVWKGKIINARSEDRSWLKQCWVGTLADLKMFDRLNDTYVMDGLEEIKLKYLGGELALITGLDDERAKELTNQKDENYLSIFKSIQKWREDLVTANRLAWVRCSGIPLSAWGEDCFSQIIGTFGNLVDLAEETRSFSRVDVARILVFLSSPQSLNANVKVMINGVLCLVRLAEENVLIVNHCNCNRKTYSEVYESSYGSDIGLEVDSSMSECFSDELMGEDAREDDAGLEFHRRNQRTPPEEETVFYPVVYTHDCQPSCPTSPRVSYAVRNVSRCDKEGDRLEDMQDLVEGPSALEKGNVEFAELGSNNVDPTSLTPKL